MSMIAATSVALMLRFVMASLRHNSCPRKAPPTCGFSAASACGIPPRSGKRSPWPRKAIICAKLSTYAQALILTASRPRVLRDGSLREGSIVETTGDRETTVCATLTLDHQTLVRFSHDSNMFSQNVTEGAGRLRYSFPGVRSARGFAGFGACCKRAACQPLMLRHKLSKVSLDHDKREPESILTTPSLRPK